MSLVTWNFGGVKKKEKRWAQLLGYKKENNNRKEKKRCEIDNKDGQVFSSTWH